MSLEDRFWSKVDRSGDCWLWTAALYGDGYGQFRMPGRPVRAHRVAYQLTYGEIDDREIDHKPTCSKRCVNPAHLRLTTTKQNQENRAGAQVNNCSSGVRGVYPSLDGWVAHVTHNGKIFYAGRFKTILEAEAAAIAKRNELFTHNDLDRSV